MTDLYLIAHKVRGEPAFDVACRMACACCYVDEASAHAHLPSDTFGPGCVECDETGYWWIIPTSGHRAYPWWHANLLDIDDTYQLNFEPPSYVLEGPGPMPPSLPDHYIAKATPKVSLAEALGINKAKPATQLSLPIHRRF